MNFPRLVRAALLAASCVLPLASLADVTVSGIKYESNAVVAGHRLVLNGAGTRYKGPFKVYTAGLYLARKSTAPDDILGQPGGKRISVTALRDIDAGELGKLMVRGVEDNMDRSAMSKLIPGLMRMSQLFSERKKLANGESFTIDWVPGTGAIVRVAGVQQGEPFKEQEFFNALLRIWIGPVPADWKLKDSLLGVKS
jgi:hypothetical protein